MLPDRSPYTPPAIVSELDLETRAGSPMPPGDGCLTPPPYPLPASEILRSCGAVVSAAWQIIRLFLGRL